MSTDEDFARHLRELAAVYGIARLERDLGWPAGKFHKAWRRKSGLHLREIGRILEVLGYELRAQRRGGIRSSVAERFLSRGETLARERRPLLPPIPRERSEDRLTDAELKILDDQRLYGPEEAARSLAVMAFEAARGGRIRDAARLMARQAAARRLLLDLEGAHVCLWWALKQLPEEPDLLLRASYLIADSGDFADAIEAADLALGGYGRLADLGGMARCLANRARYTYYSGQVERAVNGWQAALELMPRELVRQRSAAHQNLGIALVALGRLDEAAENVAQATEMGDLPGIHGGQLVWLRARLAVGRGHLSTALKLYRETIERMKPAPNHAALVTCEFVRFLLETGHTTEAVVRAREAVRYIQPSGNRIVAGALTELARAALEGSRVLKVELVEQATRRIEGAIRRARRKATRPAFHS